MTTTEIVPIEAVHQVVVVTGAGSGVGRTIARALLAEGHHVVLAGRTVEALDATAASAERAVSVQTDVASSSSVRALFDLVVERFGRVDVLVNNAGVFGPSVTVDALTDHDWAAVVATNVTGAVFCAREAVRVMRAQSPGGGRIINNGSLSAHVPRPASVAYAVSKHAVSGLTASINLDHRAQGICCTQIDIGNAATAMTAGVGVDALQPDGTRRPEPTIDAGHVGRLVAQLVALPLDVNVPQLTVMAREMPFAGRG